MNPVYHKVQELKDCFRDIEPASTETEIVARSLIVAEQTANSHQMHTPAGDIDKNWVFWNQVRKELHSDLIKAQALGRNMAGAQQVTMRKALADVSDAKKCITIRASDFEGGISKIIIFPA